MTTQADSHAGLEAKARRGDLAAFGHLVRQWDDDLRGVVWSVLRNSHDTDDVMQRSYEKAIQALSSFRERASMKTWLHAICMRTAIDHTRYENRRRHLPDTELDRQVAPSSTSDVVLGRLELAHALELLEPQTRGLVMLTVGLGYSFDEAAEISGLPRGTVASRVARAKKSLRDTNHRPNEHSTGVNNTEGNEQ